MFLDPPSPPCNYSGSMAAESIKVLDRICDVNALPVTDKDVCKTLIVKSLQQNGEVNMVIERPVEQDALNTMENALNASKLQPPSVAMASDVKDIVRRHNERLRMGFGNIPARRALTDPKAAANPNAPRVTFHDAGAKSHMSLIIGCDTTLSQQGRLRKVKPPSKPPHS